MRPRRRGTALGNALSSLGARLDRKSGGGLLQARVSSAWKRVAGAVVTAHTTGEHLRQGELVVLVDSPVWATELSALSETYRERINSELGSEAVRAVRFTVSRKVQQKHQQEEEDERAEEFYSADKVASVGLSEQERAQVVASASVIEDEALREAVIRTTIADLEWKKGIAVARRREGPREGS